jgi:hypothetical protein
LIYSPGYFPLVIFRWLFSAEEFGQEARLLRCGGWIICAIALLALWNPSHHLLDVLATTGPGGLPTAAATNRTTHN